MSSEQGKLSALRYVLTEFSVPNLYQKSLNPLLKHFLQQQKIRIELVRVCAGNINQLSRISSEKRRNILYPGDEIILSCIEHGF